MKNKDMFRILEGINLCGNLKGVKFAYALSKNKKHLVSEIEHIQEGLKPSKEYEPYEKRRVELCAKFSKKDKNDKPLIVKDTYNIEDREKFDVELKKLRDEYKDVIDKRNQQMKDYEKLLEEPANIDLHKISVKHLLDDITVKQMEMIIDFIEDENK